MSHSNAALTPRHRLKVARLVADDGWPVSEVAARFQVSWPTVKRWVDRYLAGESMQDRSSRPRSSPAKTPKTVTKRCVSLRLRLREGPVQLAARLNIAPSTVHRILRSARLNRLAYVDRETGEPVRRYEHDHPGSLVHVDVKKLGNIPDGGGWRYVGRHQGEKHRAATQSKSRNAYGGPRVGYAFVHTVIDDHSRVAYTEVHDDETAVTAVGFLHRAVDWFADRGVTIERVLSDNGGAYRSYLWRDNCEALSITSKFTRPYRPQTNGKVERFHPHHGRWLGLRPLLHQRARTTRRTGRLAPPVQPPPAPHRVRQPAAILTIDQRARSVHLAADPRCASPPASEPAASPRSSIGRRSVPSIAWMSPQHPQPDGVPTRPPNHGTRPDDPQVGRDLAKAARTCPAANWPAISPSATCTPRNVIRRNVESRTSHRERGHDRLHRRRARLAGGDDVR